MQKLNGAISNFVPSPSRRTTWAAGALLCAITAFGSSCSGPPRANTEVTAAAASSRSATIFPGERRFKSLRQLTFGGQNAEAYFGPNGDEIIYQATGQFECDQIFRMDADGANKRLVSTGVGRTTCSYIFPNQPKILYSSSHATLKTCPPRPDHSRGYVWPLLPDFEIYVAGPEGENPTVIAPHPGYDAEGVISAQGDRVLFTSTRSGDIDIWSMKPDGTDLRQLTDEVGYDGGAFFSLDGQEVVYRANHPKDPAALKDYKELLAEDLVRPSVMNLMVMNRDGSDKRVILANGAANFAPYFHPDGERIIFASNMDSDAGRDFEKGRNAITGLAEIIARVTQATPPGATSKAMSIWSKPGRSVPCHPPRTVTTCRGLAARTLRSARCGSLCVRWASMSWQRKPLPQPWPIRY